MNNEMELDQEFCSEIIYTTSNYYTIEVLHCPSLAFDCQFRLQMQMCMISIPANICVEKNYRYQSCSKATENVMH